MLTSGHDVADARLHREVAALVAAGLDVEVLGLGRAENGPPGVRVTSRRRPSGLAARLALAVALPWRARGRVLLTLDPDVVPSALLVSRLRRRRFVADVHEDYVALLSDRSWARGPARVLAAAGVRAVLAAVRRADVVVVADDHVPPRTARRRLVVRNAPAPAHLPPPSPPGPAPRALYVGDVRRSRGLRTMLTALEDAPGWSLDVVGPVASGDRAWLEQWKARSPAAERLRLHGRLRPEEAWRLAEGAWVGLSLLEDTPAFRDAVPTKLYEYLAAGLAVVTTPLPRAAAIVTASGSGVVVSNAQQLSATLRDWAEDPARLDGLRSSALRWAHEAFAGPSPYDELARVVRALACGDDGPAGPAGRTGTDEPLEVA